MSAPFQVLVCVGFPAPSVCAAVSFAARVRSAEDRCSRMPGPYSWARIMSPTSWRNALFAQQSLMHLTNFRHGWGKRTKTEVVPWTPLGRRLQKIVHSTFPHAQRYRWVRPDPVSRSPRIRPFKPCCRFSKLTISSCRSESFQAQKTKLAGSKTSNCFSFKPITLW